VVGCTKEPAEVMVYYDVYRRLMFRRMAVRKKESPIADEMTTEDSVAAAAKTMKGIATPFDSLLHAAMMAVFP
jgi:hypothetical protein